MPTISRIIDDAFALGMIQHRAEIEAFAHWLAAQELSDVIEIGTWKGGTACVFSQVVGGRLISIDLPNGPFGGASHHLAVDVCRRRNARLEQLTQGRFVGILGDSSDIEVQNTARALLPSGADLVFIDGNHSYAAAKADYLAYRPFVRPGGFVAFHDINDTPQHRRAGCRVDQLWAELTGEKREFNSRGEWGGIGVLRVSQV